MNRRIFLALAGTGLGISSLSCVSTSSLMQFAPDVKFKREELFEKLFQSGFSFNFNMGRNGRQTARISTRDAGQLILTSGKLIACDPLMNPDTRYYIKNPLKPGSYPVVLSVVKVEPFGDTRIAAAKIVISKEPTIKWEIAEINGQILREGEVYGYGVDSGTGSFLDYDAAKFINKYSYEDFETKFCDRVIAEMEKNAVGKYKTADWANLTLSEKLSANIITFHSGWGDGSYTSYWGIDKAGNPTSLITDFDLFYSDEK